MWAMDRREGFHAAVIKLRSPEWSPAFPNMNTLNVDGELWPSMKRREFIALIAGAGRC
jgi:hypothetical protein